MATRINNDVTLKHEDADTVARLLLEVAHSNTKHARSTKSAAVRSVCERTAETACNLASTITRSLWTWQ